MNYLPTFSRLQLAARCTFPWRAGMPWPEEPKSKHAGFGTAVSQAAECLTIWGDAPLDAIANENRLSENDARRLSHASFHVRELLDEHCDDVLRVAEAGMAYDVEFDRGRLLMQRGPRDYSDGQLSELLGTPDLLRVTRTAQLVVWDYKTGAYKRDANPAVDLQLRALGLASARAFGFHEVTVGFVHVDEHGCRVVEHTFDAMDLATIGQQLTALHARMVSPTRGELPIPGLHCSKCFCPLVGRCPATRAAIEAIVELEQPFTVEIQSPEHAAWTLERLRAARRALDAIEHAVHEYAKATPVPMSNGKTYALVEKKRTSIALNAEGVTTLAKYGASGAVETRVTKAAIFRAIKASVAKGKAAGTERALMKELRAAGCIRESQFTTFTEIKAS